MTRLAQGWPPEPTACGRVLDVNAPQGRGFVLNPQRPDPSLVQDVLSNGTGAPRSQLSHVFICDGGRGDPFRGMLPGAERTWVKLLVRPTP